MRYVHPCCAGNRGGKHREAKEKVETGERLKSFHGQRSGTALGRRK